jgi:hypothetical protein
MQADATRSTAPLSDDDVAPALLFIVLAALACLTPVQNDTFWHLRSGQQMWQTGGFLTTEPFSFTSIGLELHNHWWLSQIAFYAIYMAGGPLLLTMFAGGCSLAAAASAWRLVRGPWELRVGLLVWLMFLVVPGWAIRPQAVSFVFLALMVRLIARDRLEWLPIVCLIWANAHALVVLGVAMAGCLVVEALLWSRDRFRRAATVASLCAVAPMVSPLGLGYWPQVLTTVTLSKTLGLEEYRLPLQAGDLPFWAMGVLLVTLVAVRWRTVHERPAPERALILAALLLACAGATAARNIPVFALVGVPVVSWLWTAAPRAPARRRLAQAPAAAAAYAFLGIAAVVAVGAVGLQWRRHDWQASRGASGWRPLSAEIVRAIGACPEPVFNRFDDGGYLMWTMPQHKVFVDSRIEAYSADLLRQSRLADVSGIYTEPFARFGINCAVVGTGSPMYDRLSRDPDFALAVADDARAVFSRRVAVARSGE